MFIESQQLGQAGHMIVRRSKNHGGYRGADNWILHFYAAGPLGQQHRLSFGANEQMLFSEQLLPDLQTPVMLTRPVKPQQVATHLVR